MVYVVPYSLCDTRLRQMSKLQILNSVDKQVVVIVLRLVIVEEYQVRLKKTPESKHKVVPRLIAGY